MPSHFLSSSSDVENKQSDPKLLIKDSFCGQIKSFFLLDQDLNPENLKKINEFYKISQTLSSINYDSEFEGSILININAFSLKTQYKIDDNWFNLNKTEQNTESYVLFNEDWETKENSSKRSFINKIKYLGAAKKKNPNYHDLQEKKEIKIGDIKGKGIAFINKYNLLNAFLSVGNIDIFLYVVELLSDFKQIDEKKANLIVSEVISLISAFTMSEIQSQCAFKEISEFFRKDGFNFFSLLINRVFYFLLRFLNYKSFKFIQEKGCFPTIAESVVKFVQSFEDLDLRFQAFECLILNLDLWCMTKYDIQVIYFFIFIKRKLYIIDVNFP